MQYGSLIASRSRGREQPFSFRRAHSVLNRLIPSGWRAFLRDLRELPSGVRGLYVRQAVRRLFEFEQEVRLPEFERPLDPLVLFVCHGNIYRSAMAPGLLEREFAAGTIRVASAGLLAEDGRVAPADAITAAREFGVDLRLHRSRRLTSELVASADLIVVMDDRNLAVLAANHPEARGKAVMLGQFDASGERAISDPYGRGALAVRVCYRRISTAVSGLASAMQQVTATQSTPLSIPRALRGGTRALLVSRPVRPLWNRYLRHSATIFMMHRFEDPSVGVTGHSARVLRSHLSFLRRNRYNVASLRDLVENLESGEPPRPRTVVFTVDDGYADFARVAAPIFAEFDCPATTFLVTDFIDGSAMLWYDSVRYLLGDSSSASHDLRVGQASWRIEWSNPSERESKIGVLLERLKRVPTTAVSAMIEELPGITGRILPTAPPERFAAMSWSEVRHWSSRGMNFGPHSLSHPVLSRTTDSRSRSEVLGSWSRLSTEVPAAVPIFCYPNGTPRDFTDRERIFVKESGMKAAVSATGGGCRLEHFQEDRFAIPRYSYDDEPGRIRQVIVGLDGFIDHALGVAQR